MRTIDYYIDLAKEKQGFKSDNQLGKALNFAGSGISNWRVKKAYPSDEKMIELAALAGVSDIIALMDLHIWKAENDDTKKAYSKILQKITAAIIAAIGINTLSAAPALAFSGIADTPDGPFPYLAIGAILYIMGNNIHYKARDLLQLTP